jgi:hypothetical protein
MFSLLFFQKKKENPINKYPTHFWISILTIYFVYGLHKQNGKTVF